MAAVTDDYQIDGMVFRRRDDLRRRLAGANLTGDCNAALIGEPIAEQGQFIPCRFKDHDAWRLGIVFMLKELGDALLGALGQADSVKEAQVRVARAG